VNHREARLQIGAEPDAASPELLAHLRECGECRLYQEQMRALERDLRGLFERPLPVSRLAPRAAPQRVTPRRWALAASVVLAVGVAAMLFSLRPQESLAADVVDHVEHEPQSWSSDAPVSAAAVEPILRRAGVGLDLSSDSVVYARTCFFHGGTVPHLVVRTDRGLYTVMILRGERVTRRQPFTEAGYSGVLLPSAGGAIAVLTRGQHEVDAVVEQLNRAVRWLPPTAHAS
jgi:hypothetical protein